MLEVTWISTASIMIRSEHARILFDPYGQPFVKDFKPFTDEELQGVNAVFITHPHLDHFGDIDKFTARLSCPFYVCKRGIQTARKLKINLQKFRVLFPHETISVNDLTVYVYQGKHCDLEFRQVPQILSRIRNRRDLAAGFKLAIQNYRTFTIMPEDIYTFEITDGEKSVFLMGSANVFEEDPGPAGADLLVYPYQGRIEMKKYSEKIISFYRPSRVLLSHFDDAFPPLTKRMDTAGFIEYMKERTPEIEIIEPHRGIWYKV